MTAIQQCRRKLSTNSALSPTGAYIKAPSRVVRAVTATASRRHLRSAACGDLQVLTTRTVTFGRRTHLVTAFIAQTPQQNETSGVSALGCKSCALFRSESFGSLGIK